MKKIIIILCFVFTFTNLSYAQELGVNAKSAILIDSKSGTVMYENNADEKLPIASVTKIMTLLLTMEAIDNGKLSLDDKISVSENAMSMGGSTMFLETGEEITANEVIKGIAVASANDGCVAMAEHLSGSEAAFVDAMNSKAKELGMNNTHFVNTNGLDEDNHYSSARDVAIMSKELIKHRKIFEYTTIWTSKMNNDKYDLSNTNKLIRFYNGATGLKTGSTSKAGCCISATAERDNMSLIAVVLGAESSKERFNSARALLDFGFSGFAHFTPHIESKIRVKNGEKENVKIKISGEAELLVKKDELEKITASVELPKELNAPVEKDRIVGKIIYCKDGKKIDEKDILSAEKIEKQSYIKMFTSNLELFSKLYNKC